MRAVIGLGANLGDRLTTLQMAVQALAKAEGVDVCARSRVYETVPVGGPPQPPFLNAAISVLCTLSPPELLDRLLRIERDLGRVRDRGDVRYGPRAVDLDILWIEGLVLTAPNLVVPHPRLLERAFALVPLLEVAPEAIDPRTGMRLSALLADLATSDGIAITAMNL